MPEYFLLTRDGCHLCVEAIQLIHQTPTTVPIRLNLVDLDSQPELIEEYGLLIPVLVRGSDDAELKWPFDGKRLQEFLNK